MTGHREEKDSRLGPSAREAYRALDRFSFEVALLFFRMRAAATQYVGQGRHSAGRRSILKSLADGPQTVPAMARLRSVSRQHIQKLVDSLCAAGLAGTRAHPLDSRSRLVILSARGKALIEELGAREMELFSRLVAGIRLQDLHRATRLVQELRTRLESGNWEQLVARAPRTALPRVPLARSR